MKNKTNLHVRFVSFFYKMMRWICFSVVNKEMFHLRFKLFTYICIENCNYHIHKQFDYTIFTNCRFPISIRTKHKFWLTNVYKINKKAFLFWQLCLISIGHVIFAHSSFGKHHCYFCLWCAIHSSFWFYWINTQWIVPSNVNI